MRVTRSAFPVTDMGIGDLLRRGIASGAAAGLAAAVFIWLVVEPVLERALKVEDARTAAEAASHAANGGHSHEEAAAVVERPEQIFGGALTVFVVTLILGVVFAVVFAGLRHRLPGATDVARSLWLAVIGFGVLVLAPMITLPANPPAVGDPGSVDQRTGIFVLTIALAALLVVAGFVLNGQLRGKVSDASRVAVVAAAGVVVAGLAIWAVPASPDGIASDMGAQLVWDFRLVSLGLRGLMFAALGLVFGVLVAQKAAKAESEQELVAA